MTTTMDDHIPTIDVWQVGQQTVVEYCPFCGRRHFHGTGNGVRYAHCVNVDLQRRSYRLRVIGVRERRRPRRELL